MPQYYERGCPPSYATVCGIVNQQINLFTLPAFLCTITPDLALANKVINVIVGLVGRLEDAWAHRWAGIRMRLLPPESVGLVGRLEDAWAHRWAGIRMRLLPPESNSSVAWLS